MGSLKTSRLAREIYNTGGPGPGLSQKIPQGALTRSHGVGWVIEIKAYISRQFWPFEKDKHGHVLVDAVVMFVYLL